MGGVISALSLEEVSLMPLFLIVPSFGTPERQGTGQGWGERCLPFKKLEKGDYERGTGKGELARNLLASGTFQAYPS